MGSDLKRFLFNLPYVKDSLSAEEVLESLNFWQRFPSDFNSYAWFTGELAKSPGLYLIDRSGGNSEHIGVDYTPFEQVDQKVCLMGSTTPQELVQFHGKISKKKIEFSSYGDRYLLFGSKTNKQALHVLTRVKKADAGCKIEVHRFLLPFVHRRFTELLAKEFEVRNIDCRNFLRSSEICRTVTLNHQRFFVTNSGPWSNCIDLHRFSKEFPKDASIVQDAELSCRQLEAKLKAEILKEDQAHVLKPPALNVVIEAMGKNDSRTEQVATPTAIVEETKDKLTGQALRLFSFLVSRKYATNYDTLRSEIWSGKDVSDKGIKTAIERLAGSLNKMQPQTFEIRNEFSSLRVRIDSL